jgi:uncharacterized protein YbbC (DUF1343 family)
MGKVQLGIEKILASPPSWLTDKRIGLLTNQASVDSALHNTVDLLVNSYPHSIKALLGPQHGFRGEKQDNMVESQDFIHPRFNLPVFSLYGTSRVPTQEMLELIDILVIDLQDIGARVYTFISTLAYCLIAAQKQGKKVVVLDRPNPISGTAIEGNLLKDEFRSFVGVYHLPMRHGLTIGEAAGIFNNQYQIGCDLEVIPMEGWNRAMYFQETGLYWIPPSPNMPSPVTALVYPGQVIFEGTNLSEGRGTTTPFEICGAPFIDPYQLKSNLEKKDLPGIHLREIFFQPTFHKWHDQVCGGLQVHITDSGAYKPYITSLVILQEILTLYPRDLSWRSPPYEYEDEKMPIDLITGDHRIREAIEQKKDVNQLEASWKEELDQFREMAQPHFLYR